MGYSQKTFSDNASTIGLVGIIGSLSAITLTTARDGIIKRGEDQNKHMNEMNTKILETISGQLADIQSQLDLSNPNGSLFQMNKKIDGVEASLNKKIDGVETRLTQKIDGVEMRLIHAIQINTQKIEQNGDDIKKFKFNKENSEELFLGQQVNLIRGPHDLQLNGHIRPTNLVGHIFRVESWKRVWGLIILL
ncbi:hypothetical protein HC766_04005 [Candidatus Gracilibacteria bacterium]|nr:hypothetical protein [Candidatus Gracilibacteria bacterium]